MLNFSEIVKSKIDHLRRLRDNLKRVDSRIKTIKARNNDYEILDKTFNWLVTNLEVNKTTIGRHIDIIIDQLSIVQMIHHESANGDDTDAQKSSIRLAKDRIVASLIELDRIEKRIDSSFDEWKRNSLWEQTINKRKIEIDLKDKEKEMKLAQEWSRNKAFLMDLAVLGAPISLLTYLSITGACNVGLSLIAGMAYFLMAKSTLDSRLTGETSHENNTDKMVDASDETTRFEESLNDLISIRLRSSHENKELEREYSNVNIDEFTNDLDKISESIRLCEEFKNVLNKIII